MTTPTVTSQTQATKTAEDHAQTFLDWTKINSKALTAGAVVVLVAAGGFWFYQRSQQIQAANAQKALLNAKQSLSAGNLQLAQTDLQNVYSRYGSTEAGVEAAMLLAQVQYDAGKPQDAVTMLDKVAGTRAASSVEGTVRSLEGDGYAQMGKLTDAAKQYEAAASATTFENEKAFYAAKAARTYQAAGDTAKARQIWQALATTPNGSMAAEAKVRLGELEAAPVKK
jgi:predicted negative regulator of RcsB-dependent stress response